MYAIITFRHQGPLKNWQAIRAANVHNARTKPLAHAMPDTPAPKHLIGIGDLERDVKRLLRVVKLDPDQLRKNGVIAYEAILSASPAFFEQGTPDEQAKRLTEWTAAQVTWAKERYQLHRIASMVLHTDEKTPHIHLVVLPLDVKSDKRCSDKTMVRWKLVGRTISGPGRFDEAQDVYAAAMAPFGLIRGVRGSGRKHEPVPVYLKRMAAKERYVDDARSELIELREDVARDRMIVDTGTAKVNEAWRAVVAQRAQMEAAEADFARRLADHAALVRQHAVAKAEEERDLAEAKQALLDRQATVTAAKTEVARQAAKVEADRLIVHREAAAVSTARADFKLHRDRVEAARVAVMAERDRLKDERTKIDAAKDRLQPVFATARDFLRKAEAVPASDHTPRSQAATAAAYSLRRAATEIRPTASEVDAGVLAQFNSIRQAASTIGA